MNPRLHRLELFFLCIGYHDYRIANPNFSMAYRTIRHKVPLSFFSIKGFFDKVD